MSRPSWYVLSGVLIPCVLVLASCDGGGDDGTDLGSRPDVSGDVLSGDPGTVDLGLSDPGAVDPGPLDPGVFPGDAAGETLPTDIPAEDPGPLPDPGAEDPGILDSGADSGPGTDASVEEWPPSEPWWGTKVCRLPPCDPTAASPLDLSGLWTQTLKAIRHDCNPLVETLKPEIKPGTVTTHRDQSFVVHGTCVHDSPDGVVSGVLRGDTMINCIVMPPEQGVTAMPTGWLTFGDGTAVGESTVYLYGIPMLKPTDCSIEYEVTYTRQ